MGNNVSANAIVPISDDIENSPNKCYICLENCEIRSKCSCISYCHPACFQKYLETRRTNTCPYCRKRIPRTSRTIIFSPNLVEDDENGEPPCCERILICCENFFEYFFSFTLVILVFGILLPFLLGIIVTIITYYLLPELYLQVKLEDYILETFLRSWIMGLTLEIIFSYLLRKSRNRRDRRREERIRRERMDRRIHRNRNRVLNSIIHVRSNDYQDNS